MKVAASVCFFIALSALFFSVERCSTNSSNVRTMNEMMRSSPLGMLTGGTEMTPAMPASTKYGLFFTMCFTTAGIVLLIKSKPTQSTITPHMQVRAKQMQQHDGKAKGEQDVRGNTH
jgi:hypothetical protein